MKYFGVNKKVKVESKYLECPKERLKQNEVVTHLIEGDINKFDYVPDNFDFIHRMHGSKFNVTVNRKFDKVSVYLTGKRKELQEEFGKLNEVKVWSQ